MKKIYLKSLLTALLLLCSSVASAYDFKSGIYYNITSSSAKTVEVTYSGWPYSGVVTIPATVTHPYGTIYSVTSIGDDAFKDCSDLTGVTIPYSITLIGQDAFSDCTSLASITIPNNITSVEYGAFYNCTGLTAVHISNLSAWCKIDFSNYSANPLCYAGNLYLNKEKVTNLIIPDNITTIKDYAFYNCKNITSITIPNSVTKIGNYTFSGCNKFTSITIPSSVTSIGNYAFKDCTGITKIYSMAEVPAVINETSFSNYSATLYVPYGAKRLYETTNGWKKFSNIVEMEPVEDERLIGDVNGDGYINVADITTLVEIILSGAK